MAVIQGSLFRDRAVGLISPNQAARQARGFGNSRFMQMMQAGKVLGDVTSPFIEGGIKLYEDMQVRDLQDAARRNVERAREEFGRKLGDEWGDKWRAGGRDQWSPERDPNVTAPFAREALQAGVAQQRGFDVAEHERGREEHMRGREEHVRRMMQMPREKRDAIFAQGGGQYPEYPESGGTLGADDIEMFNKLGGTKGYLESFDRETSGEPPGRAWNLLTDEEQAEREQYVEAGLKKRFDAYSFSDVAAEGADDSYGVTRNRMLQALRSDDEAGAQSALKKWEEGGHKGSDAKDVWERMSGQHIARARHGLQNIMTKFPTAQERSETKLKSARELRRSQIAENAEKRAVAAEGQRKLTRPIDLKTKKANERSAFFKSGKWKAEWEQGFAKTAEELSRLRKAKTLSAEEKAKRDKMKRQLDELSLLSDNRKRELSWRMMEDRADIVKSNAAWVEDHNRVKYRNAMRQGKLQRKKLNKMDKDAAATGKVDTYLVKQDFQKARSASIAAENAYNKLAVKAAERTAIIEAGRAPTRDIFSDTKSMGRVRKFKTEGIELAASLEKARFRRDQTRKKEREVRAIYTGLGGGRPPVVGSEYSSPRVKDILEMGERPSNKGNFETDHDS